MEELLQRIYSPEAVAVGPSSLVYLATAPSQGPTGFKVVIHDDLVVLARHIAEGSHGHREYLARIIRYYDRSRINNGRNAYAALAEGVASGLLDMVAREQIVFVTDRDFDPELAEALRGLYTSDAFTIALSPKVPLLRNIVIGAYSWSKTAGGVVIEKSRRVFSDLGHHVAALQLPEKADQLIAAKANVVGRFFRFPGGKAVKFFIGTGIAVGGALTPASPILTGAGLVIAFTDP